MKYFIFEIYTCNELTGEKGWEIKFVAVCAKDTTTAKRLVKDYPNFDTVISFSHEETFPFGDIFMDLTEHYNKSFATN